MSKLTIYTEQFAWGMVGIVIGNILGWVIAILIAAWVMGSLKV